MPSRVAERLEALDPRTGVDEVTLLNGGHSPVLDERGIELIARHDELPHA